MPEKTIDTKTLPKLPLVAVLDELFEKAADKSRGLGLVRLFSAG